MTTQVDSPTRSRALHRFAILSAAVTFILIFVGGLVTSTGSALAVPDWPLAYGHLIPKLVGGVRFEYGHRVVAGTVVILTLIMALWGMADGAALVGPQDGLRRARRRRRTSGARRHHGFAAAALADCRGACGDGAGVLLPDGRDGALHRSRVR